MPSYREQSDLRLIPGGRTVPADHYVEEILGEQRPARSAGTRPEKKRPLRKTKSASAGAPFLLFSPPPAQHPSLPLPYGDLDFYGPSMHVSVCVAKITLKSCRLRGR